MLLPPKLPITHPKPLFRGKEKKLQLKKYVSFFLTGKRSKLFNACVVLLN